MRQISKSDILTIYFKTPPNIMGEGFVTGGIVMLLFWIPKLVALAGFLFIGVGIFFMRRKLGKMKVATRVLRYGTKTVSELANIRNTNTEHNSRTVKEYEFIYTVDNNKFIYFFRSALHRKLEIGDKMTIFYLPEDPDLSFIPELYSLDIG